MMSTDNEFNNLPIERSVIVLGIVAGAALCTGICVLAVQYFSGPDGFFLHQLAMSMSG